MKLNYALALLGIACSTVANADPQGVLFKVVLKNGDQIVASPSAIGEYGKVVTIELSQTMKVIAVASEPNAEGNSLTSYKLTLFHGGAMQPAKEMSMLANLSKSPSLEYSVPGTAYRFVVVSRQVALPRAKG